MSLVSLEAPLPFPLAETTPNDRYFDYCLQPYRPRRPPAGKLRAENLLWHSLHVAGAHRALSEPVRAIQQHVGRDLTVWGTKWAGGSLFWELYFYDPRREAPELRVASLAECVAPWWRILPQTGDAVPWFMLSFELPTEVGEGSTIDALELYLAGEDAHAGRSYRLTPASLELRNTYRFFDAKPDVRSILALLDASAFADLTDARVLAEVLPPELFACKKICVAKKRERDAVYFSGITVEQLAWFLERFDYPAPLRVFVARHAAQLDHLYFDVGIDYRTGRDGSLEFPKTSFYGTL